MTSTVDEARKTRKGTVVSTAMDKTITVEVEREFEHPLYVKRIRRDSRFKVHDEREEADPGDYVRIIETRPTSRTKSWKLGEIIVKQEEQALEVESETELDDDTLDAEDTPSEGTGADQPSSQTSNEESTGMDEES